ncbi:MAG: cytochrome c biogenesis protein CcdA [Pyrinomonadaceae bacterium]
MEGLSIYNILISFAGGILSFLSPCVFPLVPGYISMISGVSINGLKGEEGSTGEARRAVILNSIAFNAGLSLIFLILGGTAGLIGSALLNNIWVRIIGGLVIIIFGLQMLGIFKIGALYKDTRFLDNNTKPAGFFSSFTLGLAFAAGWTPCIGPILGGIIGLAASTGGWQSGLILSAFYSLGLAIPFLLVGVFFNWFLTFFKSFKRHLHTVEIISGILLIAIGLLVASGYTTVLNSSSLAAFFPNLDSTLSLQETKPVVATQNNQTAVPTQDFPAAPAFVFEPLEGKINSLSELRGRVVMVNLWATWCLPCRKEIPALTQLQKDYEANGLSVVGVTYEDDATGIKDFKKDFAMDYTVAVGKEPIRNDLYVGLPTTFIIDREGRLRKKITGERTREQFEAVIKPLLEEK